MKIDLFYETEGNHGVYILFVNKLQGNTILYFCSVLLSVFSVAKRVTK